MEEQALGWSAMQLWKLSPNPESDACPCVTAKVPRSNPQAPSVPHGLLPSTDQIGHSFIFPYPLYYPFAELSLILRLRILPTNPFPIIPSFQKRYVTIFTREPAQLRRRSWRSYNPARLESLLTNPYTIKSIHQFLSVSPLALNFPISFPRFPIISY